MKNKIIVIGAGSWGTALANLLAKNNFDICLIAKDEKVANEINLQKSNNNFLPKIVLSSSLKSATNLALEAADADFIFIVTPSQVTSQLLIEISQLKLKDSVGLVLCTKGLHGDKLQLFHQLIEEILPQKNYAILAGPNFAQEVANETPTITTIASRNKNFAQEVAGLLRNKYFKAEISTEVVAAEVCSIIKNIMAIGCGIVDGLSLGQNAKAALVMQGISEIKILCEKFGSKAEIDNAAGFGDIFLTCASNKSRNNSLGLMIAQGQKTSELLSGDKTYEGAVGAQAIERLAAKLGLRLPLCRAINHILQNGFSVDEVRLQIVDAIVSA